MGESVINKLSSNEAVNGQQQKKIAAAGGEQQQKEAVISNEQKEANFLNKVKKNEINSRTCQQVSRNIGVGSQILSDLNVSISCTNASIN